MHNYEIVEEIFNKYKKSCAKLMRLGLNVDLITLFNDSVDTLEQGFAYLVLQNAKNKKTPEEAYVSQVNFIFSLLDKTEKEIILKDFVFNDNRIWWNNKHSRSTYYRLRERAIKKFLSYFDELN